jgi:hypothetical protein
MNCKLIIHHPEATSCAILDAKQSHDQLSSQCYGTIVVGTYTTARNCKRLSPFPPDQSMLLYPSVTNMSVATQFALLTRDLLSPIFGWLQQPTLLADAWRQNCLASIYLNTVLTLCLFAYRQPLFITPEIETVSSTSCDQSSTFLHKYCLFEKCFCQSLSMGVPLEHFTSHLYTVHFLNTSCRKDGVRFITLYFKH